MNSFEIEFIRSGTHTFIDRLVLHVGGARFGQGGGPSERGLVLGEIRRLLEQLAAQCKFPKFLSFLGTKKASELFAILDDGCWGSGHWSYEQFDAPGPFTFLALPAATELFDRERAYFVALPTMHARIVYRDLNDRCVKEVQVVASDYVDVWRSVLARVDSS